MLLLCFIVIILKVVSAKDCTLTNEGNCYFTIICNHSNLVVPIPPCKYRDDIYPYITFVIQKSAAAVITRDFFATNFNTRIRMFKAADNDWTNITSSAFSNLTNVLSIDLSNSRIVHIEAAFKGLTALDFLSLSHNKLDTINPGTFLISDNETNLQLLDLSYNQLSYLSSDMFVNLSKLTILYLQGNNISVLSTGCFGPLINLNVLNLSFNVLTSLNRTLTPLALLREIDVSYNYLTNVPITEFEGLFLLQKIDLSRNKIECIDSDYFERSLNMLSIDFKDVTLCD